MGVVEDVVVRNRSFRPLLPFWRTADTPKFCNLVSLSSDKTFKSSSKLLSKFVLSVCWCFGVFDSFCQCPGLSVVPATSQPRLEQRLLRA